MVYLKRLCHFFTYYCKYFKILLNENKNYLSGCVLFLCVLTGGTERHALPYWPK